LRGSSQPVRKEGGHIPCGTAVTRHISLPFLPEQKQSPFTFKVHRSIMEENKQHFGKDYLIIKQKSE
jgi:hypothetical protein